MSGPELRIARYRCLAVALVVASGLYLSEHTHAAEPTHPASGPAGPIECGDVLGPGGRYRLDKDLVCEDTAQPVALTLLRGARLDLQNHTITCLYTGKGIIAIRLEGRAAVVQNGTLVTCSLGIDVAGSGKHVVRNMNALYCLDSCYAVNQGSIANRIFDNSATGGDTPYQVLADDNFLFRNHSGNSVGTAFIVRGAGNRLYANTAAGMSCHGFSISGRGNRLLVNEATGNRLPQCPTFVIVGDGNIIIGNVARENTSDGFHLFSAEGNRLLDNRAENNSGTGIHLMSGAINNLLRHNLAFGNVVLDLQDDNLHCDENSWNGNDFKTSNARCIK